MRRSVGVWLAALSLLAAAFPAAASENVGTTRAPAPSEESALGEVVSGGSGGYLPVTPARLAHLEALEAEGTEFQVGGTAGIPDAGVGAVILNLAIGAATRRSSVTVWPSGAARPAVPLISVDGTRDWATTVVVPPGDGGMVSIAHTRGHVDIDVDVLGWFPESGEYVASGPERIFDTGGPGAPGRLAAAEQVDVPLLGVAGLPEEGLAAVVLNVTSTSSTGWSGITLWPAGTDRPATFQLVTEPGRTRSNLAVVTPGADGAISVRNQSGATHLALDVLGWIPADAAYRAVTPEGLLDTRSEDGGILRPGETIDIEVVGRAGVPEPGSAEGSPYAVALNLTTYKTGRPTSLTVYPAGDEQPDLVSLTTDGRQRASAGFAAVRLGEDGMVSIANLESATHLVVEVVGWFATPAVGGELTVPEDTVIPDETVVESVDEDGTIVLAPEAEPVDTGDSVVLGITDDTPEGYLGTVTDVITDPDGTQHVATAQATLEDIFPSGDIVVDTEAEEFPPGGLVATDLGDGRLSVTGTVTSPEGVTTTVTLEGKGDADACEVSGITAYLTPFFDFELRVKWKWFIPKSLTALATVGAQAGIALENVSVQCGWEFDLFQKVKTFTIGPVPVVLVFDGNIGVDVDAGLAGLSLGASASAGVTVGVYENNFPYYLGWADFQHTPFDEALLQARDLTLYAMLDLWLHIEVRIYGLIGPRVSVGPFLETFLTTNPAKPWWALDLGFAAKLSLEIDLWIKEWNFGFWEGEIPVAKWVDVLFPGSVPPCSLYGPGIGDGYEGVCRTPAPATRPNGAVRSFAERFRLISSGEPLAQLEIVPITVPKGFVGDVYPAQQLEMTGMFSDTAEWRVVWGEIPGLTFDEATGVLSGTPTRSGVFELAVEAWYGPVPEGATTPPYGPFPPPQIVLTVAVDGECEIAVTDPADDGGAGQLRQAVAEVCDGGTVHLPAGMRVELTEGELVVPEGKAITIDGDYNGEISAVIDGNGLGSVLAVERSATLTLLDVDVTGGDALAGGGVWVGPSAVLELRGHATISYNTAVDGGGVYLAADGGGLNPATLAMYDDTWISRNESSSWGAGVYSFFGTVTLRDASAIALNTSADNGGGIFSQDGAITLDGSSSISHNTAAGSGGAIATQGATVMTFSDDAVLQGNDATGYFGGAIYAGGPPIVEGETAVITLTGNASMNDNNAALNGGAISLYGSLTINGTSSGTFNSAGADGGAVFVWDGDVTLGDDAYLYGNETTESGGGIAIIWAGETVTVTLNGASWISGNTAAIQGGGIYRPAGTVTLNDDSWVSGNFPDDIFPPL